VRRSTKWTGWCALLQASQFGPGMPMHGKFWQTFWPSVTANVGFWAVSLLTPELPSDSASRIPFHGRSSRLAYADTLWRRADSESEHTRLHGEQVCPRLTQHIVYLSAKRADSNPDVQRYAKGQKQQILGQAIGLPLFMALFTFVGLAVTSATVPIFGTVISDPIELMGRLEGFLPVLLALIGECAPACDP